MSGKTGNEPSWGQNRAHDPDPVYTGILRMILQMRVVAEKDALGNPYWFTSSGVRRARWAMIQAGAQSWLSWLDNGEGE